MKPFLLVRRSAAKIDSNPALDSGVANDIILGLENRIAAECSSSNLEYHSVADFNKAELPKNVAETVAVYFEDALSSQVMEFINVWMTQCPMAPLPPFFGLIHSLQVNDYVHPTVSQVLNTRRQLLATFKAIFTFSRGVAHELSNGIYLGSYLPPAKAEKLKFFNTKESQLTINWMYALRNEDSYDKLLCLSKYIHNAPPEDKMPDFWFDLYCPAMPFGIVMPVKKKVNKERVDCYTIHTSMILGSDKVLPTNTQRNVTISFGNGNCDYRLLALARMGFPVLAPNHGVYAETLHPRHLFNPDIVGQLQPELPESAISGALNELRAKLVIAGSFYGKQNMVRPAQHALAHVAPELFVDTIGRYMSVPFGFAPITSE